MRTTMKNLDLISGIILLVAGVAVFMQSLSYPIGTFRTPGPGLFPLIASILLIALSATLTVQAVLPKKGAAIAPAPFFPEKGAPRRILLGLAGMIGYRYLLPVIGFGPSTGIFILLPDQVFGRVRVEDQPLLFGGFGGRLLLPVPGMAPNPHAPSALLRF